jgi:hypothetical protein
MESMRLRTFGGQSLPPQPKGKRWDVFGAGLHLRFVQRSYSQHSWPCYRSIARRPSARGTTDLNPAWKESAESVRRAQHPVKEDSGVAGGQHIRKTMWLKNEVAYQHPSRHPGEICKGCIHFRPPKACQSVAGFIRPGDWCTRWTDKKLSKGGI